MIPLIDLKKQYLTIKEEINLAIQRVIDDTAFSGGKYVELFEKKFAKYIGAVYAFGLNSGTSALYLALLVLGVGPGDEVIVPTLTFIATANAAALLGAKPVFVDCQKDTWQIDPEEIEKKITAKTKTIIGVHLFGQPFDVERVMKICKKHKIFLVEDAAQAHGAMYKGKKVGRFGELACFSFYPSKNLGAYGEGGVVVTNNQKYANRIKLLRNQGSIKKYNHEEIGFNMRMDGIQAAILTAKLKYLNRWNKRRKEIARIYQRRIKNPLISFQQQPKWAESVYHQFVLRVKSRTKFIKYLKAKGIETAVHYPLPCHLQKAYKHLGYKKRDLPNAENYSNECVSIPLYAELTAEEVNTICNAINSFE